MFVLQAASLDGYWRGKVGRSRQDESEHKAVVRKTGTRINEKKWSGDRGQMEKVDKRKK